MTASDTLPERRYRGDYVPLKRQGKGDYRLHIFHLRRVLFVLSALLLLYVAVKSNWNTTTWQEIPDEIINSGDLTISVRNARYAGLDAGKLPFSITADEIIQDKTNPDELKMLLPQADITLKNGQWIYMSAKHALIETNGSRMLIEDNVNVNFSEGYELQTDTARMNMKLGIILGDSPTRIQGINFAVNSDGFRIHNSGQNIALLGITDLSLYTTKSPMLISAKNGLEWHRETQQYLAQDEVEVKNAGMILTADKLKISYQNEDNGTAKQQTINLIKADGKVRLQTSGGIIYADSAIYDVPNSQIKFFGKDIYLDSELAELRAEKSLEYWRDTEIAIARGNAKIRTKQVGETLSAETIRAKLSLVGNETQISYATAEKNVEVNTAKRHITGNEGHYNFTTQEGRICGDLQITEGSNNLTGDCAIIDMRDGSSRIENRRGDQVQGTFGATE